MDNAAPVILFDCFSRQARRHILVVFHYRSLYPSPERCLDNDRRILGGHAENLNEDDPDHDVKVKLIIDRLARVRQ